MEISILDGFDLYGEYEFVIRDAKTGVIKRAYKYKNLIPTVCKQAVAAQISGVNTKDMGDDLYVALGTSTTPPAAGDTTLGTETYRKAASSQARDGVIGKVTGFFSASDCNGTYKECGVFGDGITTDATGSTDTGILYSHVAINVTKSASESLTITFSITVSS